MKSSQPAPRPIQRPNFGVSQEVYHGATGEKVTYREIKVSTQLADPALLEKIDQERAAKAAASTQKTPATPAQTAPPVLQETTAP